MLDGPLWLPHDTKGKFVNETSRKITGLFGIEDKARAVLNAWSYDMIVLGQIGDHKSATGESMARKEEQESLEMLQPAQGLIVDRYRAGGAPSQVIISLCNHILTDFNVIRNAELELINHSESKVEPSSKKFSEFIYFE